MKVRLTVLYGSQTCQSEAIAKQLTATAKNVHRMDVDVFCMDQLDVEVGLMGVKLDNWIL